MLLTMTQTKSTLFQPRLICTCSTLTHKRKLKPLHHEDYELQETVTDIKSNTTLVYTTTKHILHTLLFPDDDLR